MTSRARQRIAVMMAVGCLAGLSPLAACAQEQSERPAKERVTRTAQAKPKAAKQAAAVHKIAIQVAENNPQLMNLALNNATNILAYYKQTGQKAVVEIVTYGPGLHMFREDTSPVKQRIQQLALEAPEITYAACGNTQANMKKQENKDITLISEAKITPSGVVRLAELQEQGYAYIRP